VLAPVNDPVRLEAGKQVVLALRLAGARATLLQRTRNEIERATGADGSPPDFDAAIQSTPPLASYDPDNLVRIFGSDPRDAPLNVMGYRSRAFDRHARDVAAAPDEPARHRATTAELDLLGKDVPAIALFFSQGNFAYRPAIYDGWVFIKGTGILDKRSFLPVAGASAPDAPVAGADPEPVGLATDSGSGLSLANIISLAVLGVVLVLAAIALLQRRRDRR
jgi:peptide/nickel transport system substrate-binding protein